MFGYLYKLCNAQIREISISITLNIHLLVLKEVESRKVVTRGWKGEGKEGNRESLNKGYKITAG